MSQEQPDASLDWILIGQNVRFVRAGQAITQTQLAEMAQVSPTTLARLEQGQPVRQVSLLKICQALSISPNEMLVTRSLNIKASHQSFVLHRRESTEWVAQTDRRKTIPANNNELIRNPEERARLGRAGLVDVFGSGPSFVMPNGPGVLIDEIYQPFEFPLDVYRDCVLVILRGEVQVEVDGVKILMREGDMAGLSHGVTVKIGPANTESLEYAPQVLWIGANRIGNVMNAENEKQKRVRPRAK